MIFNLYKNRGETPLECLERFRATKPELQNESMTYLGRLDPLAEGVLLVGTGEHAEQKEREKFFGLDKEYDFTAIFGFETDTFDVMGRITHPPTSSLTIREGESEKIDISELDLIKICKIYEGEREQKYPKYSSKVIYENQKKKHPLEQTGYFPAEKSPPSPVGHGPKVALEEFSSLGSDQEGIFSQENFPSKNITIYRLQFQKIENISSKDLFARILMDVSRVRGDFRQGEILEDWNKILLSKGTFEIPIAHFSAHVSSGTYIRSLVNSMGETIGCGATTLLIKRTRVGDYKIEDSIKF
jgi:tRNA pseudouridine55 synthase